MTQTTVVTLFILFLGGHGITDSLKCSLETLTHGTNLIHKQKYSFWNCAVEWTQFSGIYRTKARYKYIFTPLYFDLCILKTSFDQIVQMTIKYTIKKYPLVCQDLMTKKNMVIWCYWWQLFRWNIIKCDVMQGHLGMPVFHCKLLDS